MGGILKSLQRKHVRTSSLAAEILVRRRTKKPGKAGEQVSKGGDTVLATAESSMGDPQKLLAELKAETRAIVDKSKHSEELKVSRGLNGGAGPLSKTKSVKLVRSEKKREQKKAHAFDDEHPWWLDSPPTSSPQVDLLVPAAREALNDILTEDVTDSELPLIIRKAVNIAGERVGSEIRLSSKDLEDAIDELLGLMKGKGPLQPLYEDPAVTDIYLDGHKKIKCIRRGQALETPFRFRSADEYSAYIDSMLQSVDRVLNLSSPIVDCVLDDIWRSRVNAVHHTLIDGDESAVVIRVPRLQQITFFDLLQTRTLPATLAAWLSELVAMGEANILVIGPTGSGKTVFATALLSAVRSDERVCTIEDVPEIFVPTSHIEKLVVRPENSQGKGAVGMDQLLRASLRRAPHRIVVGEIRDKEGPLFLKALETGHAGSVATIHALDPKDGLWRLLDIVAAYEDSPQESIQRRIARSVNVLISMKKINGHPCMIDVAEVRPPVQGEFIVKPLISFVSEDERGKRTWKLEANHSHWIDKLEDRGVYLEPGMSLLPVDTNTGSLRD